MPQPSQPEGPSFEGPADFSAIFPLKGSYEFQQLGPSQDQDGISKLVEADCKQRMLHQPQLLKGFLRDLLKQDTGIIDVQVFF